MEGQMKMDDRNGIVFLTIVSKRNKREALLESLTKSGCHLINIMYGRSSIRKDYLLELLGMVEDEDKLVINMILSSDKTDQVFHLLNKKFQFNKPDTGIAFTIPVEMLSL